MSVRVSHQELHERCHVAVPGGSHFTIYNLPFGIFRTRDRPAGVGVAIGNFILDLRVLADSGLFRGLASKIHFEADSLNSLFSQGPETTVLIREKISAFLTGDIKGFSLIRDQALVSQADAIMMVPMHVGDYTDFYSSEQHARNVGKLFRSEENALMPNWKHLPVGYHGRASSIITTGAEVIRPNGQILTDPAALPEFAPCRKLDFELELAFMIGRNSKLGEPVHINETSDYIAGFVLMNDWSARDIQQWEYRPLGPFLGKSFATAISPWVVLPVALEPFRVAGPSQKPKVLPYLKQPGKGNYDIELEVELKTHEGFYKRITAANSRNLYWSPNQQLAHHTVNGCNVKVGDLMASGTISGKKKESWGSMLEQTFNGREPMVVHRGVERTFLEDGDNVSITGWAGEGPYKVGFGTVSNTIAPATEY